MHHMILRILALCLFLFQTGGAYATDTSEDPNVEMSLSTIILFALDNNPDLLMAQERITQMEEFTNEARSAYWPQVELSVEGGRQYVSPTSGNASTNYGDASVRVRQKIYDGYATTSEVNRRQSLTDSTDHRAASQRNVVIMETIKYYLDVLRFQSEVQTIERFMVELDRVVSTVNEMYQAGAVSKVMNDYALSRHASSRLELSRKKSSLNDAISNLEFLTGALPDFIAVSPDNLTPENYEFEMYFDMAEGEHSNVKINMQELEALRHKLNSEKAAYYPELDFNVSAEQKHNDGGDVGAGSDVKAYFSMNYDIFDGFLRKHKTNRVSSEIKELEYKNKKIVKELRKDLQLSYHQILAAQTSLDSVHAEIKNNITVKFLNEENFRLGHINVIELIEGEERLKDSYLKRHGLRHDLHLNKYSLLLNSTVINHDYFCSSCDQM
ncbi:MAG: TolC family protein [Alphaproteobacteria bacterium]